MARHSFRDPVSGVLKAHGFVDTNEPGDLIQEETDDFALQPGRVRWDGAQWVPFVLARPQRDLDRDAVLSRCDELAVDVSIPPKLQAFMAALRKVL